MAVDLAFRRSEIMRAVRGKDTAPELTVRRAVHGLGYRYRLHGRNLPGQPDLVFASRRKLIFVHGCFWHGHDCPRGARTPKANRDYWLTKIGRNRQRDIRNLENLGQEGWSALVLWECELREAQELRRRLLAFLQ